MELEDTLSKNTRSFLGINFRVNRTKIPLEKKKEINDLIEISDSVHHVPIKIILETKVDPRYSAKEGKIFIPLKYSENNNYIFTTLKKYLGDKFEEVVILHEMGHAVEVDRKPLINGEKNFHQINIKNNSNYCFK